MIPIIPLQTHAGNGALAFVTAMFAGWGINSMNLPDFIMWEFLAVVAAGFYVKFTGDQSWLKFFIIIAVTAIAAATLYNTDWANTWLFSNLPTPAIAGAVGVTSAISLIHPKELTQAVINRISKGK